MASDYGLRVIGDSNIVQIDQDFRNYVLLNKYPTTSTTAANAGVPNSANYTCSWVTYTAATKQSVLAFKCNSPCATLSVVNEGSTYTYKIAVVDGYVPITIYEYGPAPNGNEPYGMRVFNESSQVVFDSAFHYMKVIDYKSASTYEQLLELLNTQYFTYSQAPNIAFALSLPASNYDSFMSSDKVWQNSVDIFTFNNTATGLRFFQWNIYSVISSNAGTGFSSYQITALILDISNI